MLWRRLTVFDEDAILDRVQAEYLADVDDEWRALVCTDDVLFESEYREFVDAWWDYADAEVE
jgi:hypothetical protein